MYAARSSTALIRERTKVVGSEHDAALVLDANDRGTGHKRLPAVSFNHKFHIKAH